MLFPGTRPNSDTVSALVNASSDAAARTCGITSGRAPRAGRGATEMATNSRPVSEAAEAATAVSRSRYVPNTTAGSPSVLLTDRSHTVRHPTRPGRAATAGLGQGQPG